MTIEEAKKLDHFVCSECSSDDDMKKPQATFSVSPAADGKVKITRVPFQLVIYSPLLLLLSILFSQHIHDTPTLGEAWKEGEYIGNKLMAIQHLVYLNGKKENFLL